MQCNALVGITPCSITSNSALCEVILREVILFEVILCEVILHEVIMFEVILCEVKLYIE